MKKLSDRATLLAGGQSVEEACKKLEVERRMEAKDVIRILEAAVVARGCVPDYIRSDNSPEPSGARSPKRRCVICPKGSTEGCWQFVA